MLRFRKRHILLACAIGLQTLFNTPPVRAASPDEVIAKCDLLASDPHDPGRYAAGVTDEQFAPGPAIEACTAAVKENPDLARSWFQLGRSNSIAEHDNDAFSAFVQAAKLGYGPAMKSIGDAYKQGRGLPDGEAQSPDTALVWYKRAQSAGLRDADKSIKEIDSEIRSNTFDPSIFQNPDYMRRLYTGDFDGVDNPAWFFSYTHELVERIGGDTQYFIEQSCKGMTTALGETINGFGTLFGYAQQIHGSATDVLVNMGLTAALASFYQDQGTRDASILQNMYKCDSPITRKIMEHVSGSYKKPPDILRALTNSKSQIESRIASLRSDAQTNCENRIDQRGFCQCLLDGLGSLGLNEDQWSSIKVNIHNVGTLNKDHPEIAARVRACYRSPT